MRSSSTLRLFLTLQNFFNESFKQAFWFGKPFRMVSLSAWYSWSSVVCLLTLCGCRFSVSLGSVADALICVMDGAWMSVGFPSVSYSLRSSPTLGVWCECRDRASAASFCVPFSLCAVKLYAISRVRKRCRRGFSISSSLCVLRMGTKGLWSVTTVKWLRPERKIWHFLTAQATAKHSSLMMAYLVSVSVRILELTCSVFHSSSLSLALCSRTNLIPKVLASVCKRVSL